jgi:hypothetical protein
MIKTLQFDYFPLLRSNYEANELVSDGLLKDELNVFWNEHNIFKDIQSSKETAEKGSIQRTVNIDVKNDNKLLLQNTQIWNEEDSIKLHAEIELNLTEIDTWQLTFLYNLTTCADNDYENFNKKFGINNELFHFKLNGEALIYNEEIRGGKRISATKEFYWRGKNPIMFELEEYGTGLDKDSRFIQIVRFTII